MDWYLQVLKKYTVFSGRARRKEYWFFVLFNFLIGLGLAIVDSLTGIEQALGFGLLGTIYSLAIFIPGLAVFVRRLHDTDRSGWWFLIAFVPIVGLIVLLVFLVQDGTPGPNRFGPNPKDSDV